eukprot:CAMPEP_0179862834 /NCGR_PEP_ID=MMETSP0982-20121206/15153_1 /TAXON_ID=483367 /ORGANISM="non described non described, Strain CCMP 2436" /LENGTH=42 /DNA_ID= /DNA_START= /DNA_END= /DNA_ORIENTATION=
MDRAPSAHSRPAASPKLHSCSTTAHAATPAARKYFATSRAKS